MRKRVHSFNAALRGENFSEEIPVWLMRQAGRYQPSYRALREKYSFSELCLTPELACQVTLLPIREFPLQAAILFSDILFPLASCGLTVSFHDQGPPNVSAPQGDSLSQRIQAVLYTPRTPLSETCGSVYAAIPLILEQIGSLPLLGFSGAPWTLMTYIVEGCTAERSHETLTLLQEDPRTFQRIFQKVEELVIEHLVHQALKGCSALQLFDSWAGYVPQELFSSYIAPSLKRIVRALPTTPVLYYTKHMDRRLEMLAGVGFSGVSCDTESSLHTIKTWAFQEKVCFQGNLDPKLLTRKRDDKELAHELLALLESTGQCHNYIFNLGHGVPKEADYDTVTFVIEFVREWGRKYRTARQPRAAT